MLPIYKLIEYTDNYSKTSGSLWEFCKGKPNDNITDSETVKFNSRFSNRTCNDSTVNSEIYMSFKNLTNFCKCLKCY